MPGHSDARAEKALHTVARNAIMGRVKISSNNYQGAPTRGADDIEKWL